jgi:ribonuclease HI
MRFGEGEKERNPKFLGITLDRTLCFKDHVTDVCNRVNNRCRVLLCLASRSWGWKKRNLRRIFITTQRSILDYAAAAWQPWLLPTQFKRLETAQNRCLRIVTGQYANTDLELLRLEADVPSYRTHSNRLTATAYEKGLRLPDGHPRHDAITQSNITHKLKRSSLRKEGEHLASTLTTANETREPITISFPEFWNDPERKWTVHTNIDIKDNIPAIKQQVEGFNAKYTIYTDGSCTDGISQGGAAAVITDGPFDHPNCLEIIKEKGDEITCSYEEEKRALLLGIDWLERNPCQHAVFCTDSLSLLQAMDNDHPDTLETRRRVQSACQHTDLVYVPGHKDIPGNELADQHAKAAAAMESGSRSHVSFRAVKSVIKKEIRDPPAKHRLAKAVYPSVSQQRDHDQLKSRREGATVAQLRSGHFKGLAYYDAIVDPSNSSICTRCDTGDIDDVEHWLTKCPQTAAARQRIFGSTDVDMMELGLSPSRIYKLAECTLPKPEPSATTTA